MRCRVWRESVRECARWLSDGAGVVRLSDYCQAHLYAEFGDVPARHPLRTKKAGGQDDGGHVREQHGCLSKCERRNREKESAGEQGGGMGTKPGKKN